MALLGDGKAQLVAENLRKMHKKVCFRRCLGAEFRFLLGWFGGRSHAAGGQAPIIGQIRGNGKFQGSIFIRRGAVECHRRSEGRPVADAVGDRD